MTKAKLFSKSTCVESQYLSCEGLVSYCARVSNPSASIANLDNDPLIDYLIRHKHWSPFEMVSLCLEVETSRLVARQLLRHRSFSFQEFSQRYSKVDLDGYVLGETRLQDKKNRQNSLFNEDDELSDWWESKQEKLQEHIRELYDEALLRGVAKEQARFILTEGSPSKLFVNGTLRSWIHYIDIRTEKGTQKEHRELALMCAEAIEPTFPKIKEFVHSDD